MGINCSSCESTNVATVKVILHDGKLQEFAYPVKVSQVLEKNPMCFVCNSDDMDFDSFISGMNGDEQLQSGHLYFALPLSLLKNPLTAEEMASLAVKASLALKIYNSGCESCYSFGLKRLLDYDLVMYTTTTTSNRVSGSTSSNVVAGGSVGGGSGRGVMVKKKRQGGGRGTFTTNLSIVLEE